MFIAYSLVQSEAEPMRWAVLISAFCWFVCGASAYAAEPAKERVCFTAAQTREKISTHKLAEPFKLMKSTATRLQAEAIGVKLCQRSDDFVYEINLLRRDGHVLHVFVNAQNGQVIGSKAPNEKR
jgi:uncharacterized membrane protein YkoI